MEDQKINATHWYDQNGEPKSDNYLQLGSEYRLTDDNVKAELTSDIISTIKAINGADKEMAVNLQLCHWFRIDMGLGMAVAKGLDIDMQAMMRNMPTV